MSSCFWRVSDLRSTVANRPVPVFPQRQNPPFKPLAAVRESAGVHAAPCTLTAATRSASELVFDMAE